MPEGYEAPIVQGLWRRVTTYGIPTVWFAIWIGGSLLQLVWSVSLCGWGWGLGLGVSLVGSEFVLLQWLTRQDIHWDALRAAQWARRYAAFYDA